MPFNEGTPVSVSALSGAEKVLHYSFMQNLNKRKQPSGAFTVLLPHIYSMMGVFIHEERVVYDICQFNLIISSCDSLDVFERISNA